jgi:hypothetical protein
VSDDELTPEWCIVGNLLPYPYREPVLRSQKMFPAGAKLFVIDGFAGMGYETVTVIGYAHRGPKPAVAHIKARYIGAWRAQLVYRPVILRLIRQGMQSHGGRRWLPDGLTPGDPAYGEHLAGIAHAFQMRWHGTDLGQP